MMETLSGRALSHASDKATETALQTGPILIDERTIIREDCVSRRYVTLTENGIITSKRKSPRKTASSWPFVDGCKVQPCKGIATRMCTVLHSRYTVLSLSYKNSKQNLFCFRIIWPQDAGNDKQRVRLLAFTDQSAATAWHSSASAAVALHNSTITRSPSGPVSAASPSVPSHIRHASMPAVSPSLVSSSRITLSQDGFPESPVRGAIHTPSRQQPDSNRSRAAAADQATAAPARSPSPASDDLAAFHNALDSSWTHVSSSEGDYGPASGGTTGVPHTPQYAQTAAQSCSRAGRGMSDLWPENGADHSPMRRAVSEDSNLGAAGHAAETSPGEYSAPLRAWGRFRLVNGLAIWREGSNPQPSGGGDDPAATTGTVAAAAAAAKAVMERAGAPQLDSFMVSHRIRGSPRQVVRTLMRLDGRGSAFWAFESISEVRELHGRDGGKQFRAIMAPPNSLQAVFVRRREFFLQLSVRRDDDDCYVVLLHSIPREQQGRTFVRTPGTVEGRIVSMGFTIAPLKPRYRRAGSSAGGGSGSGAAALPAGAGGALNSPECLVTLVLSMDLGGWLGARTLLRYTLPFWSELQRGWVEALLLSLVALGNKVDQDCFVRGEEDLFDTDTSFLLRPWHASLPATKSGVSQHWPHAISTMPDVAAAAVATPSAATGEDSTHTPPLPAAVDGRALGGALAPRRAEPKPADDAVPAPGKTPGALGGASGDTAAASLAAGKAPVDTGRVPPQPHTQPHRAQTWLDPVYYSSPGAQPFKVRGKNYLSDRKKVPSEEPAFRLAGMELVKTDAPVYHISRYIPAVRQSTAPFSFVLCFTLPYARRILSLVLIFEADGMLGAAPQSDEDDDEDEDGKLSPFDLCMARFLADKGPLRDAKLKLIPSLAQGSWVVRQAVGQTPVILGKRLKTEYTMEDAYIEADVDISANATAAGVTSLVAGAIKSLVFDIGIVLEGHSAEELPERLLGSVRLNHLDLKAAVDLDTSTEIPSVPRQVPAGFVVDGSDPRRSAAAASASSTTP
eukprot:jgi/Ulvmu1/12590/UM092_0020.1